MLVFEIGMFIAGVYLLIIGDRTNKKAKYVVQGWPRRLMAAIAMLPFPVLFLVGFVHGYSLAAQGKHVTDGRWPGLVVEGSVVAVCLLAAVIVRLLYQIPVQKSQAERADT